LSQSLPWLKGVLECIANSQCSWGEGRQNVAFNQTKLSKSVAST
jgi:hypothetical protein